MDIFQHLPLNEGGYVSKSDRRDDFSDIFFFHRMNWFISIFFFFFLRETPLFFLFTEMLYERYAYQKRMIALHDLRSVRPSFKISMKSQFYHHNPRVYLNFFNFFNVFLFYFIFIFIFFCYFRSFRDIFSSRDRAHGLPAAALK